MQNLIVNNVLIKEISLYYGTLFLTEGEDTEMLIEHETNIIPLKNDVMFFGCGVFTYKLHCAKMFLLEC